MVTAATEENKGDLHDDYSYYVVIYVIGETPINRQKYKYSVGSVVEANSCFITSTESSIKVYILNRDEEGLRYAITVTVIKI